MQRTPLWDQTFDGILAYIQAERPEGQGLQIFHAQNNGSDLIKTQSEQEIWDMFSAAFTALKADPRSDLCGDLNIALRALSLRSTNLGKTLNMQPVFAEMSNATKEPETIDDRYAFSQIDKMMSEALRDFNHGKRDMIDAVNQTRRRDMGIETTSSALQTIFQKAKSVPEPVGTDIHREMAFKLKELVAAYRKVHGDIMIQIEKASPYTLNHGRDKMAGLANRKPAADKKTKGGIILP